MSRFAAVAFDLDGTLSPVNSWMALTSALGAETSTHQHIYGQYKRGDVTYLCAKTKLLELWRQSGRARRDEFAKIFRSFPLRPEAHELVDWLRSRAYVTCLISGSMDLYVSIVADRLGIDHFYANTELLFDANGLLYDMHYDLNQSDKKIEQMRNFCLTQKLNPRNVAFVGDSENDMGLFEYTGNGILVDTLHSAQLRSQAWKVVQGLHDVRLLLSPASELYEGCETAE